MNGGQWRGLRVLMIDDDPSIRALVRGRLEDQGFDVVEAENGIDGLKAFNAEIGLVIADVGLPDIDGFSVVRALRERSGVPILMMTAAADEVDRVLGLELGADDYITKPFLPREFVARVRAVLRRSSPGDASNRAPVSVLEFGDLRIDLTAREATVGSELLALTAREFDLLAFMAQSPRQVFGRDQLLRNVWNVEPGWLNDATVTEHVRRVRLQLDQHPGAGASIVTVRSVGYRFEPRRSA